MTEERFVAIEGTDYPVLISDDYKALQAALAAGRAVVELIGKGPMSGALFGAENPEEISPEYLERVVRRNLNLPWVIGETGRLLIRELTLEDMGQIRKEPGDRKEDQVFYTKDKLEAYIRNQYGFYQYGIWAVIEKQSNILVGLAGLADRVDEAVRVDEADRVNEADRADESDRMDESVRLELGYHIFEPYRRNGYAAEACREILAYADEWIGRRIWAETASDNQASVSLIKKLGFQFVNQRYNEEGQCSFLYVRN